MLSDFEELKTKLSVVAKSIVTLGKPLRFESTFVYLRDKKILAPGRVKTWKDVGKLSEKDGEYSKIDISPDDFKQHG